MLDVQRKRGDGGTVIRTHDQPLGRSSPSAGLTGSLLSTAHFLFTLDVFYSGVLNAWSLGNSCVAYWQFSCLPAGGRCTTTTQTRSLTDRGKCGPNHSACAWLCGSVECVELVVAPQLQRKKKALVSPPPCFEPPIPHQNICCDEKQTGDTCEHVRASCYQNPISKSSLKEGFDVGVETATVITV